MRFTTSGIDPRRLSMLAHQIARQHPSRREYVHGPVHEMNCRCLTCRAIAVPAPRHSASPNPVSRFRPSRASVAIAGRS